MTSRKLKDNLKCDVEGCNFECRFKRDYDRHKMSHIDRNNKPYKCQMCIETFKTEESRDNHFSKYHIPIITTRKEIEVQTSSQYHCQVCECIFLSQQKYEKHIFSDFHNENRKDITIILDIVKK